MRDHEEGHDWIYRLTAFTGGEAQQTSYYISPHKTRFWRGKLRKSGYEAKAGRIPASAFIDLSDEELDQLADEEWENNG